jgi:hypothetical protein
MAFIFSALWMTHKLSLFTRLRPRILADAYLLEEKLGGEFVRYSFRAQIGEVGNQTICEL